jgi:hypothetical protein
MNMGTLPLPCCNHSYCRCNYLFVLFPSFLQNLCRHHVDIVVMACPQVGPIMMMSILYIYPQTTHSLLLSQLVCFVCYAPPSCGS